jgi:hypothetical protein
MSHPFLPAGYNSWFIDGDEVDGAGVNEPVWPALFDTFDGFPVMIIDADMLAAFDTECPDFVAPCVQDTITIPHEPETIMVRGSR